MQSSRVIKHLNSFPQTHFFFNTHTTSTKRNTYSTLLKVHSAISRINSEESSLTFCLRLCVLFASILFPIFILSAELFFPTLNSILFKTLNLRFQCQKALCFVVKKKKEKICREETSTLHSNDLLEYDTITML